jgi:hypothetical protein
MKEPGLGKVSPQGLFNFPSNEEKSLAASTNFNLSLKHRHPFQASIPEKEL